MKDIFFAVHPAFSAVNRLAVTRSAYQLGVDVFFLSCRKSPYRAIGVYNVFCINGANISNVLKFATEHSFILVSCLFSGYLTTIKFHSLVLWFSAKHFYPVVLLSLTLSITLLFFLRLTSAVFFTKSKLCLR